MDDLDQPQHDWKLAEAMWGQSEAAEAAAMPPLGRSMPLPSHLASLRSTAGARGTSASTHHYRSLAWNRDFVSRLDAVHVLGGCEESDQPNTGLNLIGHTGCINALTWSDDGMTLASGSDDCSVVLWRMNTSEKHPHTDFQFIQDTPGDSLDLSMGMSVALQTGHAANIFSVDFAPHCNNERILTASMDHEVRAFHLRPDGGRTEVLDGTAPQKTYTNYDVRRDLPFRKFTCHASAVKRVVAGGVHSNPNVFMSASEDGDVREFDLRTHHACGRRGDGCPSPLVSAGFGLYSLSQSKLEPHLFAVAGSSSRANLYDRRMVGRALENEWGNVVDASTSPSTSDTKAQAQCVRQFSDHGERSLHTDISDVKFSPHNADELLVQFMGSGDVALFDVKRGADQVAETVSPVSPKQGGDATSEQGTDSPRAAASDADDSGGEQDSDPEAATDDSGGDSEDSETHDFFRYLSSLDRLKRNRRTYPPIGRAVPSVKPIQVYKGRINRETTKEVNFAGTHSQYIVSGSDDGRWYMWDKDTAKLIGIWRGDKDVVNVVCPHPYLPVMAVSGIDNTIKMFAPRQLGQGQTLRAREKNSERYLARRLRRNGAGTRRQRASLLAGRLVLVDADIWNDSDEWDEETLDSEDYEERSDQEDDIELMEEESQDEDEEAETEAEAETETEAEGEGDEDEASDLDS